MSISSTENGCDDSFAGTAKQQTGSKELNLFLMSAGQHLSMGQQHHAVVTNWKPRVKASAEFRSYEEDHFFCEC